MNVLKCLKKKLFMEHLVTASEDVFEEFLRISNGGLTWNDMYDLTNLNA